MIRPTTPAEVPQIVAMAQATGVFKPIEIEALQEVFDDFFAANREFGHHCATGWDGDAPYGFVYFAPVPMTERTWSMYWIVVDPNRHAKGLGTKLLHHAEQTIQREHGRILLIETSALPHYELTRRFYLKHSYEEAARIRDYYSDGDDMVMFRRRIV